MCFWTQANTPVEKAWLVLQPMTLGTSRRSRGVWTADALRTQIRSNCWIRRLTANGFFLRTLRTRTDTDHNFSATILWTSLMKLVLRGGYRGGQCLITVQLPYNSACTAFLFRGRDVAVTMNSVKILHAVRSAITAIAELVVRI